MYKICFNRMGAVAVLIIAGILLPGCIPGSAQLPLTLYVDNETAATDDTIILILSNPLGYNLFLPTVWTGIAFFQKQPTGHWVEYSYPDGFQPMLSTADTKVVYNIPAGFLEPGSYKLVLQGRRGSEGIPFTLETDLKVSFLLLIDLGLL
jgi:hypothetical protein